MRKLLRGTLARRAGDGGNASVADTPILECREMTVGYGNVPVVHNLNVTVRSGQITAILGPNGAGKSTTLLALAGELLPSRGGVYIGGQPSRAPLHQRANKGLAYVPEERSVFKSMSCRDNLRVGLADPAVALDLFPELRARLKVGGGLLSGGEQQMLALGRALSVHPKVLLVDELSLGLAPIIVRRLFTVLRQAAEQGVGILLVEQHVRQALEIADYAYVMRRGHIEVEGTGINLLGRIDEIERNYMNVDIAAE